MLKYPHFPGDSVVQTFTLILFPESHHSCHSLMLMARNIWFPLSSQIGWDYKESVISWACSNNHFPVNKIILQSGMSWHMEDFMNESMLMLLELLTPVCVSKFTKIKPKLKSKISQNNLSPIHCFLPKNPNFICWYLEAGFMFRVPGQISLPSSHTQKHVPQTLNSWDFPGKNDLMVH